MNETTESTKEIEKATSFGAKLIEPRLAELAKVLPSEEATQHFARIVITALNRTPKLKDCTPESILGCVFDLATLNLQANTPHGHAWIIPYGNQATIQIGYKGFAELAYRTSNVRLVQADVVRDGDEFRYKKGAGEEIKPFVEHTKQIGKGRSEREVLAAWSSVELMNGAVMIEVLDSDELQKIKKLANSRVETPAWKQFQDEMFKKTAVKRLLKLLQISGMEIVHKAVEIDNRSAGVIPGIDKPAPEEHKLILKDEGMVGEQIIDEPVLATELPADTNEGQEAKLWRDHPPGVEPDHEFTW